MCYDSIISHRKIREYLSKNKKTRREKFNAPFLLSSNLLVEWIELLLDGERVCFHIIPSINV